MSNPRPARKAQEFEALFCDQCGMMQVNNKTRVMPCRLHLNAPRLLDALEKLVINVKDYPAWQRPCNALDEAESLLRECRGVK